MTKIKLMADYLKDRFKENTDISFQVQFDEIGVYSDSEQLFVQKIDEEGGVSPVYGEITDLTEQLADACGDFHEKLLTWVVNSTCGIIDEVNFFYLDKNHLQAGNNIQLFHEELDDYDEASEDVVTQKIIDFLSAKGEDPNKYIFIKGSEC